MRQIVFCLILLLLFQGASHAELDIMEMVSADALAYVQITDLPGLLSEMHRTIEREGISELDAYTVLTEQMQHVLPIVPMLVGIEFEDFLKIFGHHLAVAFYGVEGEQPSVAILADVRNDPEMAAETIDELRILIESNAEELPQPGSYRGVDYEGVVGEDGTGIQFAFVENLFVLGFNGGFERVIDRKLGDGEPFTQSRVYQEVSKQVEPTGQVWGCADLEKLVPILAGQQEATDPNAEALFSAVRNAGVSLDFTGHEQKLYLGVQEPDHPIFKIFYRLLFTELPPMESSAWLSEVDGVWVGINLGDLQKLFNTLVPFTGDEPARQIYQQLRQLSDVVGVDLRKKFLPLLSGEVAAMVSLPEGDFNPKERPLDLAKIAPVIFLGLNDISKFQDTLGKIAQTVGDAGLATASVISQEEIMGQQVYRLFLSIDALLPGVALTPTATIFPQSKGRGLLALSNRPDTIRQLIELPRDTPIDARIAAYGSVGKIAHFLADQQEGPIPATITERIDRLGPVVTILNTTPDELTLTLISPESTWLEQLINGISAGVLADQLKTEAAVQETAPTKEE